MDAIDLSQVDIRKSPDVRAWPATVQITAVHFRPKGDGAEGLSFETSPALPDRWRYELNAENHDNVDYTVWLAVHRNGFWLACAFVQMWEGRPGTGAPLPSDFTNWWGDGGSWTSGVFGDYEPKAGDQVAVFLTAGNARAGRTVSSVAERSNIVLVEFPRGDRGDVTFPVDAPRPSPAPSPVPAPTPAPSPSPSPAPAPPEPVNDPDLPFLLEQLTDAVVELAGIVETLSARIAALNAEGVRLHL